MKLWKMEKNTTAIRPQTVLVSVLNNVFDKMI